MVISVPARVPAAYALLDAKTLNRAVLQNAMARRPPKRFKAWVEYDFWLNMMSVIAK